MFLLISSCPIESHAWPSDSLLVFIINDIFLNNGTSFFPYITIELCMCGGVYKINTDIVLLIK